MGGSEGSTQLELAAIFVAFVVVTTLFSFVSLGAGAVGGEVPGDTGAYPVLIANESHLAPAGDIAGYSSIPVLSGTHIDTLAFAVINTGESGAVDIARATVTVMAGDYIEILSQSGDSLLRPGTWAASLPRDGDGSMPLPTGEECTIRIHLDRPIPAGTPLSVRVRLPGALPCSIAGVPGIGASSPQN